MQTFPIVPKKQIRDRCRLCNSEQWLVDSHIIPKFHYKPLKAVEGHFYVVSADTSKKTSKRQKDITEPLLCAQCDNERLARYEDHLRKVLFGGHPLTGKQRGRLFAIEGYDYKHVKNGLLSILWRMSLSTDRYFSNVALGEKHSERIRATLLSNTEFREDEYPIFLTVPLIEGKTYADFILQPDCVRVRQNQMYRCVISGLLFCFLVGSAPLDSTEQQLLLGATSWSIMRAEVKDIPFLADVFAGFARQEKAEKARR